MIHDIEFTRVCVGIGLFFLRRDACALCFILRLRTAPSREYEGSKAVVRAQATAEERATAAEARAGREVKGSSLPGGGALLRT